MKPRFLCPERFQDVLTPRTERSIIFRRRLYKVTISEGFALQAEDGVLWRPVILGGGQTTYYSDGSTVPFPINYLTVFSAVAYKYSSMGIHDPACRCGKLQRWANLTDGWQVVDVPRALADELLRQGVIAEGGFHIGKVQITSSAYYAGVRLGAALGVGRR
jgi:hypothetical protein